MNTSMISCVFREKRRRENRSRDFFFGTCHFCDSKTWDFQVLNTSKQDPIFGAKIDFFFDTSFEIHKKKKNGSPDVSYTVLGVMCDV